MNCKAANVSLNPSCRKKFEASNPSLIESTNCLGNRLVALWIDYGLLSILGSLSALTIDSNFAFVFWIYIILACLYFPILEGTRGWTIGKYVCSIRVINEEGNPPGFFKALMRTLLRIFEVNPFILGALPAAISLLLSKSHQRIGDRLANTYVVKSKSLNELKK